jgi:hypothetical protein
MAFVSMKTSMPMNFTRIAGIQQTTNMAYISKDTLNHVKSHAATLFLLQFIVEPGFAAQAASKDDNWSIMRKQEHT